MLGLELIVHDSLHETTLADTSVSNNNEFEEEILSTQGLIIQHFVWIP
jgi:hypothetical protein